jgi:acyl-coenzyme A synthetase/AMP-(fatty) acid ligase
VAGVITELFNERFSKHPDDIAIFQHGELPVTFANLFFTTIAFAEQLEDAGVGCGDRVSIHITDYIANLALRLAILRLGGTILCVPLSTALGETALKADWAVVPQEGPQNSKRGIVFKAAWIRSPRREINPSEGGGHIVHATSGSTGTPKLRMETEAGLLARIQNGLAARGEIEGTKFIGYNLSTVIGFKSCLTALLSGQPQLHRLDTTERTLDAIAKNGIVDAFAPPLFVSQLMLSAQETGISTPALRRMNIGGGSISVEFAKTAEDVFGCEVFTEYGSTETDTIARHRKTDNPEELNSVGKIFDWINYRFVNPDSGDYSDEKTGGVLWVKPKEGIHAVDYPSMESLADEDGWICLGDIARINESGHLILLGRQSEFFNVGGNKHAPSYFENMAVNFSGVRDVVVFKVQSENGMDVMGFAVVPLPNFDQESLERFLNLRLKSGYQFFVVVIDSLPTTHAGKVDRNRLSKMFSS